MEAMHKRRDSDGQVEVNASVTSSDGWNSLAFRFKEGFTAGDRGILLVALTSSGQFWDRKESVTSVSSADLTEDYEAHVLQMVLSKYKVEEFVTRLEGWLVDFSEIDIDLSEGGDQKISVFIGERDDFISKPERPVFSFKYTASRMKAEWCFVTDPSCISILLQGLKEVVSQK